MSHDALLAALRTRLDVVADHALRDRDRAAHLETLRAAQRELDSHIAALPPDTDPRLLHFLERQSYEKAITHLLP